MNNVNQTYLKHKQHIKDLLGKRMESKINNIVGAGDINEDTVLCLMQYSVNQLFEIKSIYNDNEHIGSSEPKDASINPSFFIPTEDNQFKEIQVKKSEIKIIIDIYLESLIEAINEVIIGMYTDKNEYESAFNKISANIKDETMSVKLVRFIPREE